ncbi:maleylacetoacetate isomerase [Pandoraea sp. ISTKB]|uniref:maleylacetoacetate isomerase n=1 Tax=Pandoraea sp. ISTKB TaxID=1586708 RepID=UPI0008468FEB|nr:maleylacetoacetate isomerase [Pandoraea sp. ISTKB]ODP35671.1 maleylacetoacetate isomerase [Pandoraea sp. ISTKB]
MQLYSFFNSSTSYRIRIALALKGIAFDTIPVNIRVGEHRAAPYVDEVNASATVPAIVDGDFTLGQSLAIADYLDAKYPETRLVPQDIEARARVLELAMLISCDIHPVNNLRILKYLQGPLGLSAEQKDTWYRHWVAEGMAGVERLLDRYGHGEWCFGDAPTLADVCLIPQIANAQRMGCDLSPYPRAMAVYARATTHPAFVSAAPDRQPDYTA